MLHKTKIGVCMDYSIAYLLEEKNEEKVITIIEAESEETVADSAVDKKKHIKDHAFFKKVFDMIKDFDKVALFGPEAAKRELLNRIMARKDLHIEVLNKKSDERITEMQKIRFINDYFEN